MKRAIIVAAILLIAGPVLANYVYRDGNGALQTFFDFACPAGHCSAQVIIDSSGNEKGTAANPLTVATLGAPNVTPTNCSGSIANGNGPQTVIAASATIHGFSIGNIDSATGGGEPICISLTGPATCGSPGSWPLGAPAATSLSGMGSYTTPVGFGPNAGLSVVAATAGHAFSCFTW